MDALEEKKPAGERFSVAKRLRSFSHAARGLRLFVKTTHNAWIHSVAFFAVVALGVHFQIDRLEWAALVLAAGLVFASEAFNTAIEIDMNLTSPQYHPFAKDTKDVAAGAVLISAGVAAIVGAFVFYPYII